jgi:hypothetical protein
LNDYIIFFSTKKFSYDYTSEPEYLLSNQKSFFTENHLNENNLNAGVLEQKESSQGLFDGVLYKKVTEYLTVLYIYRPTRLS